MHGEADAAAHGDAVHVCDVGFWVGGDEVVELVFELEVGCRGGDAGGAGGVLLGEGGDVTAGAEGTGACPGDEDHLGEVGGSPFLEGGVVSGVGRGRRGGEGGRTLSRGIILRAMEALRELSFLGRFSSMVRTP